MVVASAGFGKSSLLRELEASDDGVRICTLGDREEGLAGFARAFATLFTAASPAAASNAIAKASASEDGVAYLASWLGRRLRGYDGTIVLDDLHRIEAPEVYRLVAALVEMSGPAVAWILSSRTMPPLPIGSWVAKGWLGLPYEDADLAFSREEVRELAAIVQATVAPADLDLLWTTLHGWPIAVALALDGWNSVQSVDAMALRTREMLQRFAEEQIFRDLERSDLVLLQIAAMVPVVDAPLAAVAGGPSAENAFAALSGRVRLLARDSDGWRLHDLARGFVLARMEARERETIAREVGRVYEARGRFADALAVYGTAGDEAAVERVLRVGGLALIDAGERDAVYKALPLARGATASAIAGALAAARGHADVAMRDYRDGLTSDDDRFRNEIRERLAVLSINRGAAADAIDLLEAALRGELPTITQARYRAVLSSAYAVLGRTAEAISVGREAVGAIAPLASLEGSHVLQRVAYAFFYANDLDSAEHYAQQAVRAAREVDADAVAVAAYSVLCAIAQITDAGSGRVLDLARELTTTADRAGDLPMRAYGLRQQYLAHAEAADDDGADRIELRLSGLNELSAVRDDVAVRFARALRFAGVGRSADAERSIVAGIGRVLTPAEHAYRGALLALIRAAAGNLPQAIDTARSAVSTHVDDHGFEAQKLAALARTLSALALWRCGQVATARRLVHGAVAPRAARDRLLVAVISDVVHIDRSTGSNPHIRQQTMRLERAGLAGWSRLIARVVGEPTTLSDVLSVFEIAILAAFRDGASTDDVARRLDRAPRTITNQLSQIYGKLGVRNRTHALAVAAEHGIFDGIP